MKTGRAVLLSAAIAVVVAALLGGLAWLVTAPLLKHSIDVDLPQRTIPHDPREPHAGRAGDGQPPARKRDLARTVLAPVLPALRASERPALRLDQAPMPDDDAMASKIGGRAYWTARQPYPRDRTGRPLHLLAQLDLAALRLDGFPRRGLLQFFIAADDFYGANLDALDPGSADDAMKALSRQENFRVVYWPRADARDAVAPPAAALAADDALPFDPARPQRLVGAPVREAIGGGDVHAAAVLGAEPDDLVERYAAAHPRVERDALDDAVGDYLQRFGSKLGGYPDFTQQDPRPAGDRRVLLLQLDSAGGMMWGDSGVANFFIDPDDLARADFSRVAYHWDCY